MLAAMLLVMPPDALSSTLPDGAPSNAGSLSAGLGASMAVEGVMSGGGTTYWANVLTLRPTRPHALPHNLPRCD